MKVLYIGNYRDGSGWGNAAIEYILALDASGVDIVPRFVKLNKLDAQIPTRLTELENKDTNNCNVVIQQVLPHMLDYRGEFEKNITLYFTETDNIKRIGWHNHINLMDEAWVASRDSVVASRFSDVEIPMSVFPVPCDPSKYSQRWEKMEFPELKDKFVFYFIGEVTRRKNLVALLKAFHLEFETHEPVGLLIKANYPGLSPAQCSQKIVEMVKDVKKQLKKFKKNEFYKGEVVITQHLTDDQIMRLHASCDCFVMPSFGEGWCLPAFDAMAMGKTPICTNVGGMRDFIEINNNYAGWLVDCNPEPCFGMADCAVPELYTGMENWWNIEVNALAGMMRLAYEMEETRKERASCGIDRAYDFSYEVIGEKMRRHLENGKTLLSDRSSPFWEKHNSGFMVEP